MKIVGIKQVVDKTIAASPWWTHLSPSLCLQQQNMSTTRVANSSLCVVQINTFQSWKNIANADALIKLAPAAGATLVLLLTLKFGRNPLALPAVLVCIPVSPAAVCIHHACACLTRIFVRDFSAALWHVLLCLSVFLQVDVPSHPCWPCQFQARSQPVLWC